jgi:hypothetical protein
MKMLAVNTVAVTVISELDKQVEIHAINATEVKVIVD